MKLLINEFATIPYGSFFSLFLSSFPLELTMVSSRDELRLRMFRLCFVHESRLSFDLFGRREICGFEPTVSFLRSLLSLLSLLIKELMRA